MAKTKINYIEHIDWVDIARGIAIVFIVLIHTSLPRFIGNWFLSAIMPFFFFISGFLYQDNNQQKVKAYILRKIKKLMLPYVYFSLIVWFGFYLLDYKPAQYGVRELWYGWTGIALWFVPVLFITESLFASLRKLFTSNLQYLILFIFSLTGYYLYKINFHLPFKIEVVLIACFFYGTGYFVKDRINKSLNNINIYFYLAMIFCFIFSFILSQIINPSIDLASNTLGIYLPSIVIAFLGIASIILFSYFLSKKSNIIIRAIKFTGKNTFIILSLHQIILMTLKKFMEPLSINYCLNSIIRHLLLWVILYLCIILVNRHFPFLIGKKYISKNENDF